MDANIQRKLGQLDFALQRLVNAHIRAITPKDQFADMYESLDASIEASAAINAFLSLKAAIERDEVVNATAAKPAGPALPPMRTRQAFGLPHIDPV